MLDPGGEAPSFELPDHTGTPVSLDELRGNWVVLYFYPRADTPGCTTQACAIRDSWDEFHEQGVVVLGVSDDPVGDLTDFAEKYDLPFRLLSDEDGTVASQYDSYGEKTVFGNTVEGVFRNTYVIGPDGIIADTFEGVSPEDHVEQVLGVIPSKG